MDGWVRFIFILMAGLDGWLDCMFECMVGCSGQMVFGRKLQLDSWLICIGLFVELDSKLDGRVMQMVG